jgi:hypothetical protein
LRCVNAQQAWARRWRSATALDFVSAACNEATAASMQRPSKGFAWRATSSKH